MHIRVGYSSSIYVSPVLIASPL